MTFGLTPTGFLIKTLLQIREDMNARLQTTFGASTDVGDQSVLGQITGIYAEALSLVWELAEAVNSSMNPDAATGAALDALCALTGTFREPATYSTAMLTLVGDDGTLVPVATQARTSSTSRVFSTVEDATIAQVDAWAPNTAYAVGDIVRNSSAPERVYECTDPGTSDSSGGPTSTSTAITDNGVVWRYLGDGDGVAEVNSACTESGPVIAVAYDISEIVTAVLGLNAITNRDDAEPGTDQMTDEDLRETRERELAGPGTGTANAILADIERLSDDISAVRVFINNTDDTDADGMPPHSVEVLVQGGEDQDIFDQLLNSVAAGIATHGTETGTAVDTQGNSHTIKFSRPEEVPIYVDITLIKDPDEYEGDDAVKAAIAALDEDANAVGRDAVASYIAGRVFREVDGILDITAVLIDDAPGPVASTTIPITLRQLATFDTDNISVTSSDGTP